jgi:hypothetical protein
LICNFTFASFCNILTKIRVFVLFIESYVNCLLNNNNRQIVLQCNNNNKNIIVNNIKIIANDNRQKYILTKLEIISFSNVVNININCASILINRVL